MPDKALVAQFEEQGTLTVRARLGEWTGHVRAEAIAWLAYKEEEGRLRNEASQALQMRVALSAKNAAWVAAIAAIIAAIFAAISIAVALK